MLFNRNILTNILSVVAIVAVWWALTYDLPAQYHIFYPSPGAVIDVLFRNTSQIFIYSLTTWWRIIAGLVLGGLSGMAAGVVMSASVVIYRIIDPVIELIRPIPPIALSPFFIIWFGLGDLGQLLMIGLTTFMIVCVSSLVAIRNVAPNYVKAARSLGAGKWALYATVLIPAIAPAMLGSVRVASASAFGVTVAAEYLGAQGGLGYMIRNARVTLDTDSILLAALLLGVLSLATDHIIRFLFWRVTLWAPRWEEMT
jgi:taurine transport system permease protein